MFQTRTRSEILMHGHLLAESADPLPVNAAKTVTLPVLNEIDAE